MRGSRPSCRVAAVNSPDLLGTRLEAGSEQPGAARVLARRDFIIGAAALGTAALSNLGLRGARAAPMERGGLQSLIPAAIGPWSYAADEGLVMSRESPLTEKTYDDVLTRVYIAPQLAPLMLLVGYSSSQDDSVQLHRPESCYPAAGFRLEERPSRSVALRDGRRIEARCLTATAPDRIEQILYWTRVGREFPVTYFSQRISAIRQDLVGRRPDGVLVRISAIGTEAVAPQLERFAMLLANSPSGRTRALVAGAA